MDSPGRKPWVSGWKINQSPVRAALKMAQSLSRIIFHIVFCTKEREKLITDVIAERLYPYINSICATMGCHIYGIGGMEEHVHILLEQPRTASIAETLNAIKSNSSRWMCTSFPECRHFSWQSGYGVFSVSQDSIETARQYVENQKRHHEKQTFEEEFVSFLNRAKIPYDNRYLWT